jgi:hypothetical protein
VARHLIIFVLLFYCNISAIPMAMSKVPLKCHRWIYF